MATSASLALVQTIYIAYYGRPADPGGLRYWCDQLDQASGELAGIIDAFGNSPEFFENFGALDEQGLVNNLFQQMFGRDAEPAGLAYYVDLLQTQSQSLASIALDIANGAQNDDLATLDNRRTVAEAFTTGVEERAAPYGQDQLEAVKTLFRTVSSDPSSVDAAILFADRLIEDFLGNPSSNDDFSADDSTAGTLQVEGSSDGVIESLQDQDWFAVELAAGETYNVALAGSSTDPVDAGTATLALAIYDAQGLAVLEPAIGSGPEPMAGVDFLTPADGVFYIAAEARDYWLGDYTLSLSQLPPEDDYSDDLSTTGEVAVDGSVAGIIETSGDEDWFAVNLVAEENYALSLSGIGSDLISDGVDSLALLVYDADGSLIDGSAIGEGSDPIVDHEFSPSTGGTFYLAAEGRNGWRGDYELAVEQLAADDDFSADVNTEGRINIDGQSHGEIEFANDHDWFKVTLDAGEDYQFELSGAGGGGGTLVNLWFTLHDGDGTRLGGADVAAPGMDASLIYTAQQKGDYYLSAQGNVGSDLGTYTLSATLLPSQQPDDPDPPPDLGPGFGDVYVIDDLSRFLGGFELIDVVGDIDTVALLDNAFEPTLQLTITENIDLQAIEAAVVRTGTPAFDFDFLDLSRVTAAATVSGLTATTTASDDSLIIGRFADYDTLAAVTIRGFRALWLSANTEGSVFDFDFVAREIQDGSGAELANFNALEQLNASLVTDRDLTITVNDPLAAGATIVGGGGNDNISGDDGDDLLIGGAGADTLAGGNLADTYRYRAGSDSTRISMDVINTFDAGDDIDIAALLEDLSGDTDTPSDKGVVDFAALTTTGFFGADSIAFANDGIDSRLWADIDSNGDLDSTDFELSITGYLVTAVDFSLSRTGTAAADALNSGKTADRITALGGADTIVLGAGVDSVELGPADTATDLIDFVGASDLKFISDFETAVDRLSFDGIIISSGSGNAITATTGTAVTAGALPAAALTGDRVYVVDDGAQALTAAGVESITDYRNRTDIAAYLAEGFTSTAAADTAIFVISDLVSARSFVFFFDEDAGTITLGVDADDLTLIGVITEESGQQLLAGDIA